MRKDYTLRAEGRPDWDLGQCPHQSIHDKPCSHYDDKPDHNVPRYVFCVLDISRIASRAARHKPPACPGKNDGRHKDGQENEGVEDIACKLDKLCAAAIRTATGLRNDSRWDASSKREKRKKERNSDACADYLIPL